MKDIGYDGFISVEIAHARRTNMLYEPKPAAELVYKTVSSILDEMSLKNS